MSNMYILLQIAKANFYDEIRRDKFFLTMLAVLALIVAAVPPPNASHTIISMGDYRPLYNSAWIGTLVAVLTSIILALTGFYLLRGRIQKDRYLGIGQLYATTTLGKTTYLLGKYLSNVAVLSLLVVVNVLVAIVLQLKFGEEPYIHLWALVSPFLMITMPTILIVSALSIFFETTKGFTGLFGNIMYFLIWVGLLFSSIQITSNSERLLVDAKYDVLGISTTLSNLSLSVKEKHADYSGLIYFGISIRDFNQIVEPVHWDGLKWNLQTMTKRAIWTGSSFIFMVLSGLLFLGFDPSREPKRRIAKAVKDRSYLREQETNIIFPVVQKIFAPILSAKRWKKFEQMLQTELKKLVKETAWWWSLVAVVLIVICVVAPFDIMREWLLPTVWIWPLFIWSHLGMRLSQHYRQGKKNQDAQRDAMLMQVLWTVGVIVALVTGSGAAVRFILAGEWSILSAWIISAAFIPSLAFVLSIWTNSNYVFEGTYTLLWLVGSVSKQPLLDFMGTLQDSIAVQNPFIYFIWTVILLTFAAVGKQRLIER